MSDQITWQAIVAIVALGAVAWTTRNDVRRLAFCWGLLLPIDYVTGIHPGVFDAARYLGVLWLCWRTLPTLVEPGRRIVFHLAAAIAAVGAVRGVFALPRADRNSLTFAVVMLASVACLALLALRPQLHRAVAGGYLAGVTVSAATSILQALHLTSLRHGDDLSERYPGVSTYTMLLTWQLAFAMVLTVHLIATSPRRSRMRVAGWVALPLLLLASLTNGAQGGFVGLGAAVAAALWAYRERLRWARVARAVGLAAVGVVALAAVVIASGIDVPTIDGVMGEGGYRNEKARWDVAVNGLREMGNHPLLGMGRTNFMHRYTIAPHVLPIDSGVSAGILGFVAACYLIFHLLRLLLQGPADSRPQTIVGFVLLAAMCANTLTESYGPFIGLSRVSVLFLAVVAVKGFHPDPSRSTAAEEPPTPEAEVGSQPRGPAAVLERLTGTRVADLRS